MQFGEAELRDSYAILPTPLRSYDKGEIDYRFLEADVRELHRTAILDYLRRDVVSLHQLVRSFLDKHGLKPLTAAGAAMRYMKKLGIKVEKFNDSKDEKFRSFYSGGLVLARRPGIHRGMFTVYDIKSAYPYAMVHSHASSKNFRFEHRPRDITPQGFYLVNGSAEGCFLRRTKEGNRFGGKGDFHVTGWELLCALKYKRFRGQVIMGEIPELCTDFKPYVNEFFDQKQKAEERGDKAGRLIAKIMLNALYGKFAQRGDRFRDYVIMPSDEPVCGQWEEESVWDDYGFAVWGKPSEGGNIYNVSTAASITGFVRAMLMKAIYETEPYYCDTDSIITDRSKGIRLAGDSLGSWHEETRGDLLYIAGKKLYALRIAPGLSDSPDVAKSKGYYWDGKRSWKIASKGCRLTPEEMKSICQGNSIDYKNDAPSYSLLNSPFFVKRTIRATAPLNAETNNKRKKTTK
jgi:hypothetical protein